LLPQNIIFFSLAAVITSSLILFISFHEINSIPNIENKQRVTIVMDLLIGYGSSSSDDEEEIEPKTTQQKQVSFSTSSPSSLSQSKISSAAAAATTTTETMKKNPASVANKMTKKRGKKLLKLSAVLPEHIWNQLSKNHGAGNTGADDSDDDDDNMDTSKQVKAQKKKTPATSSSIANDASIGLLGLLQELPKSKSSVMFGKSTGSSILKNTDEGDGNDENADQDEAIKQKKSAPDEAKTPLGFAFLTSTVETTKRKRNSDAPARDIHAKSQSNEQVDEDISDTRPVNAIISTYSSSDSRQQPLPRPSATRTASLRPAAPIPLNRTPTPTTQNYNYQTSPYASSNSPSLYSSTTTTGTTLTVGGNPKPGNKKMSRKRQMEQMLRAGRINDIQEDHELEATAHVYQPSDLESSASSRQEHHGVRVVPTSSYDVGAGATVASTAITGRQKNKHQLNSLLASAASLEAHRAQNPHLGSGSGAGSSHRSTAKRKYGW
jgi:hypothetical protein